MEILEEKLREAACQGDLETVYKLIQQDININAKQTATGWTALHWACKKGHEDIIKLLLSRGADPTLTNNKNETPIDICSSPAILNSFMNGNSPANNHLYDYKLRANILKNSSDPTLPRIKHSDITYMPSTMLPSVVPDEGHHFLLMWQSDPCVVIGRHQNPYVEANIADLKNITPQGVVLARRNSGGGTVFHDNGNLNLSFLTTKECYNRKYNLEVISRAVSAECGLNIEINKREDLLLDNYKVSGTASKLGRPNAYHHCTLLVNANKDNLSKSLKKMKLNIETNATKSVPSKIMNLCEKKSGISIDNLMKMIGIEYMKTPAFQGKNKAFYPNSPQGFKYINPSEAEFPGLHQIRELFSNWQWIYGKTPKFIIKYNLPVTTDNSEEKCTAILTVENGIICEIGFILPKILKTSDFEENVKSVLNNSVFSLETFIVLKEIFYGNLKTQVTLAV